MRRKEEEAEMEVVFWGTRGSLPPPLNERAVRSKVRAAIRKALGKGLGPDSDVDDFMDRHLPFSGRATYGVNTSCVEIRDGDHSLIFDAGSGIRDLGNEIMRQSSSARRREFHILLSHLHWDHIQGFPFFVPAMEPGNRITIYGCHPDLKAAFAVQHGPPFFPLGLAGLGADLSFVHLDPDDDSEIAGFKVTPKEQNHPGKSYGYRVARKGRTVVYSTDAEHKNDKESEGAPFTGFFHRAHLLIFDAQYTFADACTIKEDWGHSNNLAGVELAQKSGVRRLCLFHHDPNHTDEELDRLLVESRELAAFLEKDSDLEVTIAYDGLRLVI